MNEQKDKPSILDDPTKYLLSTLGVFAGVGSLLYAMGFIIVNVSLSSLGVRDYELAKPTYISAGTAFFFISAVSIIAPLVFSAIILSRISSAEKWSDTAKGIVGNVVWVPTLALSLILIIALLSLPAVLGRDLDVLLDIIPGFSLYVVVIGLITLIIAVNLPYLREQKRDFGITPSLVLLVVLLPVLVFLMLYLWGTRIYPKFDSAFGGGIPVQVQLQVIEGKNAILFKQIGVDTENNLTEPLRLIDITDDTVVVLLEDGQTAKITRSLIANIVFVPSPKPTLPLRTPTLTPTVTPTPTPTPIITPPPTGNGPEAQRVVWALFVNGPGEGICVMGSSSSPEDVCSEFISWALKEELELRLISQVPQIPAGCTVSLEKAKKGQSAFVQITSPQGSKVGSIWFGLDPNNNWALDGLVRVTDYFDPGQVWGTFERYSDGSYLRIAR